MFRPPAKSGGDDRRPSGEQQPAPVGNGALPAARDPYGTPGYGYGYGHVPEVEGTDFAAMAMRHLRTVLKHKWLILGAAVLFVAIGGVSTAMKTPLYTATAQIQIASQPAKIVDAGATMPSEYSAPDFLRTEYELLKSRAMAERVVSMMNLAEDKAFFAPRNPTLLSALKGLLRPAPSEPSAPATALEAWATGIVASSIAIRPVPGSRLVNLSYTDPSPQRAERIANAYADAYIASNLDKRFQANAYARTFLDDQIKQLKLKLGESERALLEFAEREKLIEIDEETSIAASNLAAANSALGNLISERMRSEQSWEQVKGASEINLPQFLSNGVIDGLRARRNALVTEYEEKLETFKPNYPAMVQIINKIKEIDRQLAAEVTVIKDSIKASYQGALQQENEMKLRIGKLSLEVLETQKKSGRYNILKGEVEANRSLYNSLLQRFKEVDIASGIGTNNVFVVDRAVTPGAPSEPKLSRALMLSLMLGSGAGLGLAYLIELFNDKIRVPEEIEQLSGLTTLGVIPTVANGRFEDELSDPRSAVAEAYRSLATTLQFATEAGMPRSLAVTSAGPGEGKTTTALAIARHFALMGQKVLVIDADMRKPSMHIKLGQSNAEGLSNYLTGAGAPPNFFQSTASPNLAFMSSGPLPPNAADLLAGPRMFSLVSIGAEVFDLIVVDTPPLLGLADAQLLGSVTSATVFVVAADKQRKGAVRSALRRLQLARCSVVGAVLTHFNARAAGYWYGYGYGYGYGADAYSYGQPAELKDDRAPGDRRLAAAKRN